MKTICPECRAEATAVPHPTIPHLASASCAKHGPFNAVAQKRESDTDVIPKAGEATKGTRRK